MARVNLSVDDKLYKKLQEAATAENTTVNYLILSILEEKYLDENVYDYSLALEQMITESKEMGEEFTLAELPVFKKVDEVIIERQLPVTSASVRARLGKMFNEAVRCGNVPDVKRAVVEKDGKEELKFVARAAVYNRCMREIKDGEE